METQVFEMLRHVDWKRVTNVPKTRSASIFKTKQSKMCELPDPDPDHNASGKM